MLSGCTCRTDACEALGREQNIWFNIKFINFPGQIKKLRRRVGQEIGALSNLLKLKVFLHKYFYQNASAIASNVFGYGSLPGSKRSLVRVHERYANEQTIARALCRQ